MPLSTAPGSRATYGADVPDLPRPMNVARTLSARRRELDTAEFLTSGPEGAPTMSRPWYRGEDAWLSAGDAVVARSQTLLDNAIPRFASSRVFDGPGCRGPLVSAHERVEQTGFVKGAHVTDPRYKTNLCSTWDSFGECRMGIRCDFAHGPLELRKLLPAGAREAERQPPLGVWSSFYRVRT